MKNRITRLDKLLLLVLLFSNSVFSQNIGIGVNNPTRAKLELNGAVDATTAIFGGDASGISLQRNHAAIGFNTYWNSGNRYLTTGYSARQFFDHIGGYFYFDMHSSGVANGTASTINRAFIIGPNGYMGLGNVIPNAELQFSNNLLNRKIVLWESGNNDNQYYGFGINGGTLRYNVDAPGAAHKFYAGNGAGSSNLLMSIYGDKKVFISNSGGGGFLGINRDAAPYTVSIKQAAGTGIFIEEAASLTNWHLFAAYYFPNSIATLRLHHQGFLVGYFSPSGEYSWSSDRRLKTDIQNIPPLLDKIMQLKPVVYEMKRNNPEHKKTLGFIAQDVKPLFPELVHVDGNPNSNADDIQDLHTLSYSGFGVLAIKAIQEQQVLIQNQQKEIDDLKRLVKILMEKK